MKLINKHGNINSKKIAHYVADSLGLTIVKSLYGGYMLEWNNTLRIKKVVGFMNTIKK